MNKFIVFDLDGTLVDTVPGMTLAVNRVCHEMGLNYVYNDSDVKTFIGNGAKILFERAIKTKDYDTSYFNKFLEYYEAYQYESKPYKNVIKTLEILKKSGYLLFILSNKPDPILLKLVSKVFCNLEFSEVIGQKNEYPCKPDPTVINEFIIKKHNLKVENGYYVGDSVVDIDEAKNAGLTEVIVDYGYGNQQEIVDRKCKYYISDFKEIVRIVK